MGDKQSTVLLLLGLVVLLAPIEWRVRGEKSAQVTPALQFAPRPATRRKPVPSKELTEFIRTAVSAPQQTAPLTAAKPQDVLLPPARESWMPPLIAPMPTEKKAPKDPPLAKLTDVMIATVADPERSTLSASADETIDAIVKSAVRAGYVLSAHRLPWRRPGKEPALPDSPPAMKEEDQVGALIFRRDPPKPSTMSPQTDAQWLVVLLVGESPMLGVAQTPLAQALEIGCLNSLARPLHLLGPMFSGSARSLWRTLAARPECFGARIITGSATGELGEELLGSNQKYGSTVVPDVEIQKFLWQELFALHADKWDDRAAAREPAPELKIAMLRENGTGYAATFLNTGSAGAAPDTSTDRLSLLHYQLPLHLSQLRAAQPEQAQSGGVSVLRHNLSFDFAASDCAQLDAVPAFSELTSPAVDASLRAIVEDAAHRGADYMAIIATDPADTYFVAREARIFAPSAQVIAFGGQLLFAHPEVRRELSGMLMVSSYPLSLDLQPKLVDRDSEIFVSESAEGVFNAAQWLIADLDQQEGRRVDFAPLDYAPTMEPQRSSGDMASANAEAALGPRPWLMLIEDARVWPLSSGAPVRFEPGHPHRLDATRAPTPDNLRAGAPLLQPMAALAHETSTSPASMERQATSRRLSPGLWGISFLLLVVSAGQAALFILAWLTPRRREGLLLRAYSYSSQFAGSLKHYQAVACLWLGLCGLAVAASVCAILSVANSAFSGQLLRELVRTHVVSGLLFAVFLPLFSFFQLGVAIWLMFGGCQAAWRMRGANRARALLVSAVIASAAYFGAMCVDGLVRSPRGAHDVLLLMRLNDPLGPNPLMLLLLLGTALYSWALSGIARTLACESFPSACPTREIDLRVGPCLADSNVTFARAAGVKRRLHLWEWAFVMAYAVFALCLWASLRPSFAWPGFNVCARVMLLVVCGAIAMACLHAHILWSLLRRTLEDHAALPLVDAYARIATKVTRTFGLQLRSHVPPPGELALSVQGLELLLGLSRKIAQEQSPDAALLVDTIERAAPRLEPLVEQLHELYDRRQREGGGGTEWRITRRIHAKFFQASRILYGALRELWRLRAKAPNLPSTAAPDEERWIAPAPLSSVPTAAVLSVTPSLSCRLWIRAAEDFVAMRVTTYVYHLIHQLRLLLGFALAAALLVVCGLALFPLHPVRWSTAFSGSLLFVAVGTALRLILGMQRNELLTQLNPAANRGTQWANFVQQVLVYVAVPSIILLARVFPDFGEAIASRLDPLWALLRH